MSVEPSSPTVGEFVKIMEKEEEPDEVAEEPDESEEEEEQRRLRAALDPTFFGGGGGNGTQAAGGVGGNDKLVKKDGGGGTIAALLKNELPPSKRAKIFNAQANLERVHPYGLQVPPGRKDFIAKNLAKYLDDCTKMVSPPPGPANIVDPDAGIRIFSTSKEKLTVRDLETAEGGRSKKKKRKRKVSSSDSEEENAKLKSVAVSSDWVLSQ